LRSLRKASESSGLWLGSLLGGDELLSSGGPKSWPSCCLRWKVLGGFDSGRLLRWKADSSFAAAIVRGSFGMGLQRDQSGEELLV